MPCIRTTGGRVSPPGSAGYWEIQGTNAVPISEFILPINLTNVTSVVFFDSISYVGTRLDYFEGQDVVFDNRFAGQLTMRLRADMGGGSPPLLPGSGPVARVHYRVRSNASSGDTTHISVAPMGAWSFMAFTAPASFVPVFNEGTLTASDFCDCSSHGDVATNDGFFDALDRGFLIDYLFAGGTKPPVDPTCPHIDRGDYNCDGADDALDLSVLIDLLFAGGDPPCDPCACDPYPSNCP